MRTFDWALFELYNAGLISFDEALRNADSANELRLNIKLKSERGEPEASAFMSLAQEPETLSPRSIALIRRPRQAASAGKSQPGGPASRIVRTLLTGGVGQLTAQLAPAASEEHRNPPLLPLAGRSEEAARDHLVALIEDVLAEEDLPLHRRQDVKGVADDRLHLEALEAGDGRIGLTSLAP